MGVVWGRLATCGERAARQPQIDVDRVNVAVLMMAVGYFDHHLAAADAVTKPVELCRVLGDVGGNRIGVT